MPAERMHLKIMVTDEAGDTFTGRVELSKVARGQRTTERIRKSERQRQKPHVSPKIDFSLPTRAFVKEYVRGMGGPQKFVLLIARMAGGKEGVGIELKGISKEWGE